MPGLLIDEYKEHFIGVYLDKHKHIIKGEIVSIGTLTASMVHPRETFKPALAMRASYIIVLHNHPSGDVTPTPSDIRVTRQLIKAGEILGVEVIRHVIFSCMVRFSEVGATSVISQQKNSLGGNRSCFVNTCL
jgi:DNA repair protein RadC